MSYTSGKYAFGICDRCGDKIKYKMLKKEWTGFKVCQSCLDHKTPQDFPNRFPVDPETLREPRPDTDVSAGNGTIFTTDYGTGQTPIGSTLPAYDDDKHQASLAVGQVTVVIS